jgi:hypothetical protein
MELPDYDNGGEDLNCGVKAEADQSDGSGDQSRCDGYSAFDDIPDDDEPGKAQTTFLQ